MDRLERVLFGALGAAYIGGAVALAVLVTLLHAIR